MSWVNQPQAGQVNPLWDYREGMKFISIVPNTSRPLILLTGEFDPTGTWKEPLGAWVHSFRGASGGSATVVCSRYKRACPFCYENEIFKLGNPRYKDLKQKLPYSPKFNALLQVYDVQMGSVFWALFTKTQIDGVNFLMTNFPTQFKNMISLSRIGAGLNTSYRVDNFPMEITPQIWETIKAQIVPFDETIWNRLILSDEEIKLKSGIDSGLYFAQKLAMNYPIDISSWGEVPKYLGVVNTPVGGGYGQPTPPPAGTYPNVPPISPAINQYPPPPPVMGANVPTVPNSQGVPTPIPQVVLDPATSEALNVVCTMGVYSGQTLGSIIKQTGKTYITYLSQASTNPDEKASANILMQNWEKVNEFVTGALF